jgi:hypothetical protein
MKRVVDYLKSMLSSGTDASSKRAVGVGGFVVLVAVIFINIFTGKAPEPYVVGALVSVIAIAFGGVAIENIGNAMKNFNFTKQKNQDNDDGGIPKANL